MPLALLTALAASLFTHAVAVFLPEEGWLPGREEDAPPTLTQTVNATLETPPLAPPRKNSHPKPRQPALRQAQGERGEAQGERGEAQGERGEAQSERAETQGERAETQGERAETQGERGNSSADASSVQAEPAEAPLLPPPGASPTGRVTYRVYQGTRGFEVGQTEESWGFSEGRYTLTATTQTRWLAGLLYPVEIKLESTGRFGPQGFEPEHFQTRKNGQATDENVDFDREKKIIRLSRNTREHTLLAGSQDLLSFHFQLAYLLQAFTQAPEEVLPSLVLPVATGKRYDTYRFTLEGEETLPSLNGDMETLHIRARASNPGADTTDIWLARQHHWLPVKIRFTDRNEDVFEQVLDTLTLRPPQDAP